MVTLRETSPCEAPPVLPLPWPRATTAVFGSCEVLNFFNTFDSTIRDSQKLGGGMNSTTIIQTQITKPYTGENWGTLKELSLANVDFW